MRRNVVGLVILIILTTFPLTSCVSMGGPGIIFVQESHPEDWIKFYKIELGGQNSSPVLISNVSVRGENKIITIDPTSLTNRAYWAKETGDLIRSYEDTLHQVSSESYFKNFKFPIGTKQIFLDWWGWSYNQKDIWRKNHFIYFLDQSGNIWAVNNATEKEERWNSNIVIPSYATDVHLLFNNPEYPVIYVGADRKPTRINARTGREQTYLDVIIEKIMIPDEITGNIYEIEDGIGLVYYDNSGNKIIMNTNILNQNIVAPRIINGIMYFGISETEDIKTRGKTLF